MRFLTPHQQQCFEYFVTILLGFFWQTRFSGVWLVYGYCLAVITNFEIAVKLAIAVSIDEARFISKAILQSFCLLSLSESKGVSSGDTFLRIQNVLLYLDTRTSLRSHLPCYSLPPCPLSE